LALMAAGPAAAGARGESGAAWGDVRGEGVRGEGRHVPAGFVLMRAAAGEAEILSLGVAPLWRRHGIGRVLLRAAMATAQAMAATRLFLEVAQDNRAARALYVSEGFTAVGCRPAYYRRGPGLATAAVVFRRDLT
ncbi:MAG: GNAT family N-acetyltransferase, partial [Alphaproteobacteria bacterium]